MSINNLVFLVWSVTYVMLVFILPTMLFLVQDSLLFLVLKKMSKPTSAVPTDYLSLSVT